MWGFSLPAIVPSQEEWRAAGRLLHRQRHRDRSERARATQRDIGA